MSRISRITFSAFLMSLLCSVSSAVAFQDAPPVENKPGYNEEIPADADPLKGEPVAATRIQEDAGRLSSLSGDLLGEDFGEVYGTLFDGSVPDAARLKAADELESRSQSLDRTDPLQRSVADQLGRRIRLVKAGVGTV